MHIDEKQIEDFIVDSGLVSRKDVDSARKEAEKAKESIGKTLVSQNKITPDDLRRIHAYVLGIPFVNLKEIKIEFDVLSMIPEPIARKHNIISYQKSADTLEVAMLDIDDLASIEFIKKKVGLKILSRLTDEESIKSAILQYQKT
jgi:type IV pilus assembly protein PilB